MHTFVCKFGWVQAVPVREKCYRQIYGKLEKLENSVSEKVCLPSDSHTKTVISD